MAFRQWTSLPAVALILIVYASTLSSVFVTDHPRKVPRNTRGLNITQAWDDLDILAPKPHPYNSHANDVARKYLLSRLEPIAAAHAHVSLVDDLQSTGSWGDSYFEGTNILVKIEGTDPKADAVLFSAHYDSVSTSTGTVDDGMSVVALLQLVNKFANQKHRRTAIFNFNNGEEDGLHGAYAFLQHPWSNLTTTFLNLEGAASGGRPVLFRGTDTYALRAFLPVPHPHGNVLAADAFERGLVRSQTDYVVYTAGGHMQGLDVAFYKGRSRYHTRYDAIPWVEGGQRALWAMMETADGAGSALLDQNENETSGTGARWNQPVYFDLFGRAMLLFSLGGLRVYNIVFLVIVPIGTVLLVMYQRFTATGEWRVRRTDIGFEWLRFLAALVLTVATQIILVLLHLVWNPYIVYSSPYLVFLSALSLTFLTLLFPLSTSLPQKLHRSPLEDISITTSVLLQLHILSYILLLLPTALLPTTLGGTYLLTVLATCVFLGWAVGVIGLILFDRPGEFASASGGPTEQAEEEEEEGRPRVRFEPPPPAAVTIEEAVAEEPLNGTIASAVEVTEVGVEPTETTLLIHRPRRRRPVPKLPEWVPILWWYIQMLLVVPLPVILFAHILVLFVGATSQTVVDGGPVWIVYAGLSAIAVLLLLPLAPFLPSPPTSEMTPRDLSQAEEPPSDTNFDVKPLLIVAGAIFVLTIAYLSGLLGLIFTLFLPRDHRLGFPFSVEDPLKVFFEQKTEVLAGWYDPHTTSEVEVNSTSGSGVRAYTYLVGVSTYISTMILPMLPSARDAAAKGEIVQCVKDERGVTLVRCAWPVGEETLPIPGGGEGWGDESGLEAIGTSRADEGEMMAKTLVLGQNAWLKSSVTRRRGDAVRIKLQGKNTRSCRVYFDGGNDVAKVKAWRVLGGSEGKRDGGGKGVTVSVVKLWSRTWEREFVLDVDLVDTGKKLTGKVACEWVEYESGSVGVENGEFEEEDERVNDLGGSLQKRGWKKGQIPAYEEVLKFFPRWAVTTKAADGLVEVWAAFQI